MTDRLTDDALRALAVDLDSPLTDRRLLIDDTKVRDKACRALCAFANDINNAGEPGVLFVGVADDGSALGVEFDERFEQRMGQLLTDGKTQPIPVHEVRRVQVDGVDVAAVVVQPYDFPPVRYGGDIWVRRAARVDRATPADERRLVERRQTADVPFESRPMRQATVDDLDLRLFQLAYLPAVQSAETLAENNRPVELQLQAQRLVTADGCPTNAGVLLIGKDPRALIPESYVQMVRIDGAELADPVLNHQTLEGPLVTLPETVMVHLAAWIQSPLSINGVRHESSPDYPVLALREFMMNALVHRSYERNGAPILVYWFNDRVEIHSPGGLHGEMSADRLGQPGAVSYRNPRLAEAFRGLDFIEYFGRGIEIARRALARNGNPPPEFQVDPYRVTVTLRRRP